MSQTRTTMGRTPQDRGIQLIKAFGNMAKANEAFFVGNITPNESPEIIYQKLSTVF